MKDEKYIDIWNNLIEALKSNYIVILPYDEEKGYLRQARVCDANESTVRLDYYADRGDLELHYFVDNSSLLPDAAANHQVVHTSFCNVEMEFHMWLEDETFVDAVVDWFSVFFKEINS